MSNTFLILLCIFPSYVFSYIGYSTKSSCLEDIQSDKISLACPPNQLIKLGRIIYGYSWSNDCSYIDKDCTMNVPRDDIICSTISNCTVRVVEHPLILQDCWNLAASYVQAEYECVTDYSIENICQSQDLTSSHGFISTPNYPHGFLQNLNCPCSLVASPGHSIILEIIDFHLPTCAEAGLILWIGQDHQTKCVTQDPITLISNVQQNITFRFYTLKQMVKGGFLMKYSVSPESKNASVRLQCYTSPNFNRSALSSKLLITKYSPAIQNAIEQKMENDFDVQIANSVMKRVRPTDSFVDIYQNKEGQIAISNQSIYNPHMLPNLAPIPRANIVLIILFIVSIVIFLVIINTLIWFVCSLRTRRTRSTSSIQNLYAHPTFAHSDVKASLHPPINRLKTLHSLLYANRKTIDIEPTIENTNRNFDSALSDIYIPTNSSSTNIDHGFIIKSKSDQNIQHLRQINSWDDI